MSAIRGNSARLLAEAQRYLAGGVSSNFRSGPPEPLFYTRAFGSHIVDADGREYIDYVLGQGPMILGHAPPVVVESVARSLREGQLYAGQHALEVELSKLLQEILPCAGLVRYGSSGSEVVQLALRVARAATGRERFVKFEGHYHGWFDNVLYSVAPPLDRAGPAGRPCAVPGSAGQATSAREDVLTLPWNDLAVLDALLAERSAEVAAVIMEPVMCNTGCIAPETGYLEGVRALCDRYGVVLVFDEIITGFRLGLSGAEGCFGVTPDLATFGKAMASGFPLSCLAGRVDLMDLIATGGVVHGGTFNTNVPCTVAAHATVSELARLGEPFYDELAALGKRLMAGIESAGRRSRIPVCVQGPGMAFHVAFTDQASIGDYRAFLRQDRQRGLRFVALLLDAGIRILPRGMWYLSAAHTDADIDKTLDAVSAAFEQLAREE